MFFNKFILASKSKSRALMLKNINLSFSQIKPICNEKKIKEQKAKQGMSPEKLSLFLAKEKAKSVSKKNNKKLVVGSDTIIELNGKIINKASSLKKAEKKIKTLSGKKHNIFSSAAAYYDNKLVWCKTQKSVVKIRNMSEKDIKSYLKISGKSILHSVGCYQIERGGPTIIENIKGDFFNVMGFPLFPFLFFLNKFSIKK